MPPVYNLKSIRSPRLTGLVLDVFSRLLRWPIVGRLILSLLKKINDVPGMVRFANECHPRAGADGGQPLPLYPLYYPIHDMTTEEEAMHHRMASKTPLDLGQLAAMKRCVNEGHDFRHWAISDYTSRYSNGTVTPSQVVERIISVVEDMNSTSIVSQDIR